MDFYEVIQARQSVRAYTNEAIAKESLLRILEAAQQAPSAINLMPWRLVVVSDQNKREEIAKSGTYGKFLTQSPIAIVGLGDPTVSPKWYAVDTTIALEHIVLAATAEGLGSCWIGGFDEKRVKEIVEAPDNWKVIAIIAIGHPRNSLGFVGKVVKLVRPTKSLEELVCEESFRKRWSGRSG